MPTSYETPGVYVEEISTLPPSVAEVSTAIPAFIGYTEKGGPEKSDEPPTVARINTMLEFTQRFGGADLSTFKVEVGKVGADSDGDEARTLSGIPQRTKPSVPEKILFYCLSHYFKNGGGSCYIVSIGNYRQAPVEKTSRKDFENGLTRLAKEDEPTLILLTDAVNLAAPDYAALCDQALAQCAKLGDRFAILDVKDGDVDAFRSSIGTEHLKYGAAYHPYLLTSLSYQTTDQNVEISDGSKSGGKLADIESSETALYQSIELALGEQRVVLPPSAAVAGIYASVDRERGVWKAPANAGVAAVIGPITQITSDDQRRLNIDPTAGKSINAIRAFTGKGTLVWGARTLAGNDNEWRYVPVRRLFNMIEESCQKATAFAVFEPNDMTTWLKVKGMIESFLYGLWEKGAFAGATAEEAYFVSVGLGKTMTPQDVLEGRMKVEVGVAAVRPAEFIVLTFTHKLQEA